MSLTPSEQAKILRFLGYANWKSMAQSFHLGYPASTQPEFLVRMAFDRIAPESLTLIRRDLDELESIEWQMSDARKRLKADKLGNLTINKEEIPALRREMDSWIDRLADDLGVYPNPFAKGGGLGRNARVINS